MYCGIHVYEKLDGMSAWLLGFIALRELLGTTRLASGTHDRGVPPFEMHIQPLWADDLIDDAEFWQTEQRFDTIDIHEQGSSF
jgi:hypothetical protein